jgi:hypothetical protein
MTVKNQIKNLSGDQLKRLLFIIQDGETVTHFSRREDAAEHRVLL